MSTFSNKMTAVAAEVRTIDGVNDTLSLDEMAAKLAAANQEIENQATQIESITTALEGKAAGGGGGASVDTCTVEITADSGHVNMYSATIFQNGEYDCVYSEISAYIPTPLSITNVVCGTSIYLISTYGWAGFTTTNCEFSRYGSNSGFFKITASPEDVATIHCYDNDA